MYKNFNEYYSAKQESELAKSFQEFANLALDCEEVELLETVLYPVIAEGNFTSSRQLMNEFLSKLMNKMGLGGNKQDLGDEHEDLQKIDQTPHMSFRPAGNDRNTSWTDKIAANREAEASNKEKDGRNIERQRVAAVNQAGSGLMQKKKAFENFAATIKDLVIHAINSGGLVKMVSADPIKKDVFQQFIAFLNKVSSNFKAVFQPQKYAQDADYSGVKSGLGADHEAPKAKLYPGADGGDGHGIYPSNQQFGDNEKVDQRAGQDAFKARARQIRAR